MSFARIPKRRSCAAVLRAIHCLQDAVRLKYRESGNTGEGMVYVGHHITELTNEHGTVVAVDAAAIARALSFERQPRSLTARAR
jgi:hypothetical protein